MIDQEATYDTNGRPTDDSACSKAIFSPQAANDWSFQTDGFYLLVRPRYVELKDGRHMVEDMPKLSEIPKHDRYRIRRRSLRRHIIEQRSDAGQAPQLSSPKQSVESTRGVITTFSRKAGTRMKKRMLSFLHAPDMWFDLTYADDVMAAKGIEEQRDHDNAVFKRFKRKIERQYPKIEGISRREWQTRKSGHRKGAETPHRHNLIRIPGLSEKQKMQALQWIQRTWVDCTQTIERDKALKVALHKGSYRLIDSERQAQIYVSKYVSKFEEHDEPISRGRFWMTIGKPILADVKAVSLTRIEDKVMRRFFRRSVGKRSKLAHWIKVGYPTWIEINEKTVYRMLECTSDIVQERALRHPTEQSEVPF